MLMGFCERGRMQISGSVAVGGDKDATGTLEALPTCLSPHPGIVYLILTWLWAVMDPRARHPYRAYVRLVRRVANS